MVNLKLADISKCLTEDVVKKAFMQKTASQDAVKSIEMSRAAPAGSGLLGAVYRLIVYGDSHIVSLIAKGMVQDPLLKRTLQTAKYFKREIYFFSKVLPALIDVQKSAGGREKIQSNIPICYAYHYDGENDFLLMEDLSDSLCSEIPENPTKSDRNGILQVLAHLHALSMLLEQNRPDTFEKITQNISELYYTEENRPWYTAYLQNAIDIDLKTLAEFEDLKTSIYYKKYFELVSGDPYGKMITLTSDRSKIAVINHGDAWSPNFLRSKSRTVAIDFQLLRCASPVIDVIFFIILCSKQCSNKEDALEGLKVYHNFITHYLKDVGMDVNKLFSWDDLNTDLKTYGKFGLLAATTTFPLLSSERCDVLEEFDMKYSGVEKIPLEELWPLAPFKTEDEKLTLVNAVKISVDIGLI